MTTAKNITLDVCVITLFPDLINALQHDGVVGRAISSQKIAINCLNLRDFATDQRGTVDDEPYGGGPGMVLKPEPLAAAIDQAKQQLPKAEVWCMAPDGEIFEDKVARTAAKLEQLIIVCGRYQGIDERIMQTKIDKVCSIGNFVTSGGEIPAMAIIDAIARFIPDVLGEEQSIEIDSFAQGLLAAPCYTRPSEFEGMQVPKVLLSGDHAKIAEWKNDQAKQRTLLWKKRNNQIKD